METILLYIGWGLATIFLLACLMIAGVFTVMAALLAIIKFLKRY